MSIRSHTNLKLVGAASAAALALGSAAAAPALAAGGSTASVSYTCMTPLGNPTPSAVYNVKAAPSKMAVGQPLGNTAMFTLDPTTTILATSTLGWAKFNGTITSKPTGSLAGLDLKIAKTTLGNGAGGSTNAHAKGSTLAGTKVGSFTFALGDLDDVVLNGFDSSGQAVGSIEFPTKASNFSKCTNDDGTTQLMSGGNPVTVKVVKDTTKTSESAKYSAKKKTATGTAKVKSHFGSKVTGKVKFTLKKGSKKIKTITGKVNKKGVAKASFKKLKAKGKYSITAKYTGSKTLKGSGDKATFKV
ncbi:MAG: Ig-like domain repeat protein [Nocardioides sp.]